MLLCSLLGSTSCWPKRCICIRDGTEGAELFSTLASSFEPIDRWITLVECTSATGGDRLLFGPRCYETIIPVSWLTRKYLRKSILNEKRVLVSLVGAFLDCRLYAKTNNNYFVFIFAQNKQQPPEIFDTTSPWAMLTFLSIIRYVRKTNKIPSSYCFFSRKQPLKCLVVVVV
jgi:hypothetical protein